MAAREVPEALERRQLLRAMGSAAGLVLAGCAAPRAAPGSRPEVAPDRRSGEEAEVTPGEDLMQEHGVLERVLLVYDEVSRRIEAGERFDPALVSGAAGIVRRFIEGYHEKLEEEFVFPRLRAAGREAELVDVLLLQHDRGRQVTAAIARRAAAGQELRPLLVTFVTMYRPHAAREETVLFPAFRDVVGREGYRELGERFEEREHELFGTDGFREIVGQVADLERALGIHELARFTPPSL